MFNTSFRFDRFPFPGAFGVESPKPGARFVVQAWERAPLFRNGVLVDVLGPGAYRRWTKGFQLHRVDMRPRILGIPTQEIPTADGVTVKVTVTARTTVTDALASVTAAQRVDDAVYLAVQVALREVVTATSVEQLLTARGELGAQLLAAVRGVDELGLRIDAVEVKDIVLPADLKKANAEVLVARAQGQAALERARGETAALRNLANAAKLLDDSPSLLQLRLVQQLAATTGHTVVIGHPGLGGAGR